MPPGPKKSAAETEVGYWHFLLGRDCLCRYADEKSPVLAGFLRKVSETPEVKDCVVADAVMREPVSERNSLLSAFLQGILFESVSFREVAATLPQHCQRLVE